MPQPTNLVMQVRTNQNAETPPPPKIPSILIPNTTRCDAPAKPKPKQSN